MRIIFFCQQTSARLSYIIDFFSSQINAEIIVTNNADSFTKADAIKINYSASPLAANELLIKPHPLLFEQTITPQQTDCFKWNNLVAFFKTGGDIPFDVFAAAFYLLSRYEEYLPHDKDMYGRYAHTNSLAYKENFLHLPVINYWIAELQQLIKEKFPLYNSNKKTFTFLPTYDIDIAYQYRHHPWWKNMLGFVKDSRKPLKWFERADVVIMHAKDPFDTYDWLHGLHKKYHLKPVYFFLIAEKRHAYDKNLSPHSAAMQALIKQHSQQYATGIHPSWQSGDDETMLSKEIRLLESITAKKITSSRQHYIRMSLPATYDRLIANGIEKDYSMGYGSINGFRASVAASFFWYNLAKEQATTLQVFPFCFMEANAHFEQHFTAQQAAEELQQYFDVVKKVNGLFVTIFHNHFVTKQKEWLPWRNMYADFLNKNCLQQ